MNIEQENVLVWVESVLARPEVRAHLETVVVANSFQAQQLAQRLQVLRTNLRENAYKRIFEARSKVSEDLLALQQSLSNLIHFSAVAGEDANMFISLQRSVVQVTQKLSVFGEGDADGDGVRDSQAQAPGAPVPADPKAPLAPEKNAPSFSLEVDTAPVAPDNQPQPPESAVLPKEKQQQDPNDIADENADPQPKFDEEGEPAQPAGAEPAAEEGQEPAEDAPADEAPADPALPQNLPLGDPKDAGDADQEDPEGEDGAGEEGDEDGVDGDEPEEETDKPSLKAEFGKVAEKAKAKSGKKGLFESLTEEPAEAEATAKTKTETPFRFAYRGVRKNTVSMLVTDKVYYLKPTKELYDGNIDTLNSAVVKYMEKNPGYNATLQMLRKLIDAGKLEVVKRVRLTKAQLGKQLHTKQQDKVQFGATPLDPTTPWKFNGANVRKDTNQSACLYFEVGDIEYAALPTPKFGEGHDDIDAAAGRIYGNVKKRSYSEGLAYLEELARTGKIRIITQTKIGEE